MQNLPDDEEDTAFGRLGPRAGPGGEPTPAPGALRWGWWAVAMVAVVLAALYLTGIF
ncbi:MAG: hypothetical protein KJ901_21095 [Gammaproteobacteria bacterium]|nr:hypothetical protein [Gammaproteobacteria bacterium]MBU1442846.1 hypothetical protein [Gammaproteobacteria bacterium]